MTFAWDYFFIVAYIIIGLYISYKFYNDFGDSTPTITLNDYTLSILTFKIKIRYLILH